MTDSLREITFLAGMATSRPTVTALPGVLLIKGEVPQDQLAAVYEPMIGFVIQGSKAISIGTRTIHLRAPSYFVIPTDIPATGWVEQGPDGQPYLSAGLRINADALADLLGDLPGEVHGQEAAGEFSACAATAEFIDAWLRMLRLLNSPGDIPALAPIYEREILYRALVGPQGWRLRRLCLENGKASNIRRAIQWIRKHYGQTLDIAQAASKSGMSLRTFHRQFRQITGLSPIQYQKRLRLLEARQLIMFNGRSVAEAAFEVGYESPSQFNREYSRFFGAPPARDARGQRLAEMGMPARTQ